MKQIAKSSGFQSKKMSALSYHMDQLRGILEIGSSSKGHANMDQSLVPEIILTTVASGSPSRNVLTTDNEGLDGVVGNKVNWSRASSHGTSNDIAEENQGSKVNFKKCKMRFTFEMSVEGSL
jgi:hypothetical protein